MKIDTQVLQELNFEMTHVTAEDSGDKPFDYWCLDLPGISLITNASDEVVDGGWKVYLFDNDEFVFYDAETLIEFVNVCNKVVSKK